jgi:phage terminase small subunit
MALTVKQQRFVEEYLVDLNATQAAIRSGYSAKTAGSIGQENLTKPEIAAAIAEARAKLVERTQINAEMVINELHKIAFANMADFVQVDADGNPRLDWSGFASQKSAALEHVKVEYFKDRCGHDTGAVRCVTIKLSDKHAALLALGQHLGIF